MKYTFPVFFLVNILLYVLSCRCDSLGGGVCGRVKEYYPAGTDCDTKYPYLTHSYSSYNLQITLTFKLTHRK